MNVLSSAREDPAVELGLEVWTGRDVIPLDGVTICAFVDRDEAVESSEIPFRVRGLVIPEHG